jgi:pimeloyl-ACP methyl ester carboxylesterase
VLARFLAAHAEHAKVIEFQNCCGHWLAEERPTEVLAELLEFFG